MSIRRAELKLLMKGAFAEGLSFNAFERQQRAIEPCPRRTLMLADWRSALSLKKKKGLLRYVKKNLLPTAAMQAKSWEKMTTQYMYTVRIQARRTPTGEIKSDFRNIGSDVPLTPAQVEAEMWQRIKTQSPPLLALVVGLTAYTAIERVL